MYLMSLYAVFFNYYGMINECFGKMKNKCFFIFNCYGDMNVAQLATNHILHFCTMLIYKTFWAYSLQNSRVDTGRNLSEQNFLPRFGRQFECSPVLCIKKDNNRKNPDCIKRSRYCSTQFGNQGHPDAVQGLFRPWNLRVLSVGHF